MTLHVLVYCAATQKVLHPYLQDLCIFTEISHHLVIMPPEVTFIGDTPRVGVGTIEVRIGANRPGATVQCQLRRRNFRESADCKKQNHYIPKVVNSKSTYLATGYCIELHCTSTTLRAHISRYKIQILATELSQWYLCVFYLSYKICRLSWHPCDLFWPSWQYVHSSSNYHIW